MRSHVVLCSGAESDAAAVEKTLRLAQSFTLIGGSLQESVQDAAPYVLARGQFNLCMYYFLSSYHPMQGRVHPAFNLRSYESQGDLVPFEIESLPLP